MSWYVTTSLLSGSYSPVRSRLALNPLCNWEWPLRNLPWSSQWWDWRSILPCLVLCGARQQTTFWVLGKNCTNWATFESQYLQYCSLNLRTTSAYAQVSSIPHKASLVYRAPKLYRETLPWESKIQHSSPKRHRFSKLTVIFKSLSYICLYKIPPSVVKAYKPLLAIPH